MKDLELWRRLLARAPDEEVVALLEEAASLPAMARFPFWGCLDPYLESKDPRVRSAAVTLLSGAAGYPAFSALVEGLDDDEDRVRKAALLALARSCTDDPPRFAHVLFHPREDIRRQGLDVVPAGLPARLELCLLVDPACREVVREGLLQRIHSAADIELLLLAKDAGFLTDQEVSAAILQLPWSARLNVLLDELGPSDGVLDRTMALFMDAGPSGETFFDQLISAYAKRVANEAQERRISDAIQRAAGPGRTWTEKTLALAAARAPRILEDSAIPIDLRKAAARRLPDLGWRGGLPNPLRAMASAHLHRQLDGALDLAVIRGLLMFATGNAFRLLMAMFSRVELVEAMRANPGQAALLLEIGPSPADQAVYESFLEALIAGEDWPHKELLSLLLVRVPPEGLPVFDRLAKMRPGALVDIALDLVAREIQGSLTWSIGQRKRAVAFLVESLAAQALLPALKAFAGADGIEDSPTALEILAETTKLARTGGLARTLFELEGDALVRLCGILERSTMFPLSLLEELASILAAHTDPKVRGWAARILPAGATADISATTRSDPGDGRIGPLTRIEAERIRSARDAEIQEALRPCFDRRTTGLVDALRGRPPFDPPRLDVAAALLVSHDPPQLVAGELARFGSEDPRFLEKLDRFMVDRFRRRSDLPLLGAAWLHLWDNHLANFTAIALGVPGGLARLVEHSFEWTCPFIQGQLWLAIATQLDQWRFRDRKTLLACCDAKFGDVIALHLRQMGDVGAQILVTMNEAKVDPAVMEPLRWKVLDSLGELDAAAIAILARWFDTSGAIRVRDAAAAEADGPADLGAGMSGVTSPQTLARALLMANARIVGAALTRIQQLGDVGRQALLMAIEAGERPHHPRLLASAASILIEGPQIERLRRVIERSDRPPELRFALGMILLARKDTSIFPLIAEAICADDKKSWFERADFEALQAAGIDLRTLALALAPSPHFAAYGPSVKLLLGTSPEDEGAASALERFLDAGSDRLGELRMRAADRLFAHGNPRGFPLLFADTFGSNRSRTLDNHPLLIAGSGRSIGLAATRAVNMAGLKSNAVERFVLALNDRRCDPEWREEAWLEMLASTQNAAVHEAVLARLTPSSASRRIKLKHLAETFAWGVIESQKLTGKLFRIKMIGGQALGYTRLGSRTININPLAFLRGERGGRSVVRGLIMHELGHQIYHSSPRAMKIWEEAERAKLARLLNLVLDEHLERNLRAQSEETGNHLKQLAAYAFQHAAREIPVAELCALLGMHAFPILSRTRLRVARNRGSVRINIGAVLRSLEAGASSFSRFVRALRMGLGDRHDDPKVKEALELFRGGKFRGASMDQLKAITDKLAAIFGDEVRLLGLCDLHDVAAGDEGETRIHGEGITDDELQKEIERVLGRRSDRKDRRDDDSTTVNRGDDTDFDRISTVVPVEIDPEARRAAARAVARAARKMRDYFARLGLKLESERGRIQGRRLDRLGLEGRIMRRDPRLLVRRTLAFKADLFLGVLIDCSGSMGTGEQMAKARLFATLLAEAAKGLRGIDARFWGFTSAEIFDAGDAGRCAAANLASGGGNNDAAALWHASREAVRSTRRARLLVMISDGLPTECSTEALKALVQDLTKRQRICCAQVAVRPLDDVCFPHYVEVLDDDLDAAVRRFGAIVGRLVKKTLETS